MTEILLQLASRLSFTLLSSTTGSQHDRNTITAGIQTQFYSFVICYILQAGRLMLLQQLAREIYQLAGQFFQNSWIIKPCLDIFSHSQPYLGTVSHVQQQLVLFRHVQPQLAMFRHIYQYPQLATVKHILPAGRVIYTEQLDHKMKATLSS